MPCYIVRNDIANMRVDVVVCPANAALRIGGGAGGAVTRKAGLAQLQQACDAVGFCAVGSAAVTPAFDFPARAIVHAVGPVWQGGAHGEDELLSSCVARSLALAAEQGAETVALPLISTGSYGFPARRAFDVTIRAIKRFLEDHDLHVYLVLFDRESVAAGSELLGSVAEYVDDVYVREHILEGTRIWGAPRGREGRALGEGDALSEDGALGESRAFNAGGVLSAAGAFGEDGAFGAAGALDEETPDDGAIDFDEEAEFCEDAGFDIGAFGEETPDDDVFGEFDSGVSSADVVALRSPLKSTSPRTLAGRLRFAARKTQPEPSAFSGFAPDASFESASASATGSFDAADLRSRIAALDESFAATVLRLIDERGLTDVQVYKRANMSRQLFAKIRKDDNYRPAKRTACALAIALELSYADACDLLARAGFAFSHSSKADVIVEYFLINGVYDIFKVNEALYAFDQPLLG